MKTVKFKDLELPEGFFEEYGTDFEYLHVDYCGSDGWWVALVTNVFTDYLNHATVRNYYEIGLYQDEYDMKALSELLGEGEYRRFYKVEY